MTDMLNMPKLGFGFMRLPSKDGKFDYEALNKMVDDFISSGFTYFDTAYTYYNGESERAIKKAVVDRYPRESFMLADKLPAWEMKEPKDVQRIFDEQLERTGAKYFDFYLLHSIEKEHLKTYDKFDCWRWAADMKEKGLIRRFGFSLHDSPELLDDVLSAHPEVDFVQLQINYIDWDNEIVHSGRCYEAARKHNVPIVVMEPVKGGMLASMRPELEGMLKTAAPDSSTASWALRFCLSLEGIAVILSGMSNQEQVLDNIATAKNFKPFSEQEKIRLTDVTKELLAAPTIGCTGCRYCTGGCPEKINIPDMISAYNTVLTYGDHDRPHFYYGGLTRNGGKACSCAACGQCENVCPQHLKIIELLGKISSVFDK